MCGAGRAPRLGTGARGTGEGNAVFVVPAWVVCTGTVSSAGGGIVLTIVTYICEKCRKEFKDPQEAVKCEQSHPQMIDVSAAYGYSIYPSLTHDGKYPHEIEVLFEDGKKLRYCITTSRHD
jgi:hypothetical protein